MRHISDVLHLDQQYMSLHIYNFKRCSSDEEKERYKKQLYNVFTRRNSHIMNEMLIFQRLYHLYRAKFASRRSVRSRNLTVSRPATQKQCLKTDINNQPLEIRVPATANISLDCSTIKNAYDYEARRTEASQVFSSRQCLVHNKHFLDRKNQVFPQQHNKHLLSKPERNTLTMVGLKVRKPTFILRRLHRISAQEHELLYNPQNKENSQVLPGIFKTREALLKFTKNSNLTKSPRKCGRQTNKHKMMQGLLYLEGIHKKAQQYQHVLLGQRVPYN